MELSVGTPRGPRKSCTNSKALRVSETAGEELALLGQTALEILIHREHFSCLEWIYQL